MPTIKIISHNSVTKFAHIHRNGIQEYHHTSRLIRSERKRRTFTAVAACNLAIIGAFTPKMCNFIPVANLYFNLELEVLFATWTFPDTLWTRIAQHIATRDYNTFAIVHNRSLLNLQISYVAPTMYLYFTRWSCRGLICIAHVGANQHHQWSETSHCC